MIQLKVSLNVQGNIMKHLKLTSSQTMLNCIDNTGATVVECVANLGMKRPGTVGKSTGGIRDTTSTKAGD